MRISLTASFHTQPLCPFCLCDLGTNNVVFYGRFAFCPDCLGSSAGSNPDEAIWAMVNWLHSRHITDFRNLIFFTPQRRPNSSVQLIPYDSDIYFASEAQERGILAVDEVSRSGTPELQFQPADT